jgi:hypothetical protein
MYDLELADTVLDGILRRRRLKRNISGNGSFSEDEYAELVAKEVERAKRAYARQLKKGGRD